MKVVEITAKDFNNLAKTRTDILWKRQKEEPFFYISHKKDKVGILIVISEKDFSCGILRKSTNFLEDEYCSYIPMDVLEKGNEAIAKFVLNDENDVVFCND